MAYNWPLLTGSYIGYYDLILMKMCRPIPRNNLGSENMFISCRIDEESVISLMYLY